MLVCTGASWNENEADPLELVASPMRILLTLFISWSSWVLVEHHDWVFPFLAEVFPEPSCKILSLSIDLYHSKKLIKLVVRVMASFHYRSWWRWWTKLLWVAITRLQYHSLFLFFFWFGQNWHNIWRWWSDTLQLMIRRLWQCLFWLFLYWSGQKCHNTRCICGVFSVIDMSLKLWRHKRALMTLQGSRNLISPVTF